MGGKSDCEAIQKHQGTLSDCDEVGLRMQIDNGRLWIPDSVVREVRETK